MYYVLCIPLLVPIPDPRLLLESDRSEVEGERPAEARLRSEKKFEVRSQGRTRTCAPLRPASAPRKRAGDRFPRRPGRNACRNRLDPGFLEFRGLRITQYGEVVETKTALRRSLVPIICMHKCTVQLK